MEKSMLKQHNGLFQVLFRPDKGKAFCMWYADRCKLSWGLCGLFLSGFSFPSIHSFFFFHFTSAGSLRQQSQQTFPDFTFHTLSSAPPDASRVVPKKANRWSLHCALGLSLVYLPGVWNISMWRRLKLELPQSAPFNLDDQRLYSKLLLGNWAFHPISQECITTEPHTLEHVAYAQITVI